jgi:hypothetical protein
MRFRVRLEGGNGSFTLECNAARGGRQTTLPRHAAPASFRVELRNRMAPALLLFLNRLQGSRV